MFKPRPKSGVFFMNKNCFYSSKKAFTLLELLVVTLVILILIGYFAANSSSGIEKAKIVRQQFQLAKIAEAIRLFEQDWGELPPDLSLLINPLGFVQYAEAKGVNIAPKAYLDAPKNHCVRLSWMCPNHYKGPTMGTDWSIYYRAVQGKCLNSTCNINMLHYIYNFEKDTTLKSDFPIETSGVPNSWIQQYHSNTYALLDMWNTPVFYRPYSNGKFALLSAGPDTYAAITEYSGTLSSAISNPSDIKDPTKQTSLANPKELLVLLDTTNITDVKMDSQNIYNKDNIIYSPLLKKS